MQLIFFKALAGRGHTFGLSLGIKGGARQEWSMQGVQSQLYNNQELMLIPQPSLQSGQGNCMRIHTPFSSP